ncbi:MAG TPA: ABC transporter substrate-binding protein [Stellaceae bacterium]|nr:ABC transporter substrate-binding protein [Stellaceae bacterium]
MKLPLSFGITSNPRTWPILDGRVVPDAIDPLITKCDPSELFWRQLRFADFDVSEMSMSSLMMIRAQGDDRFIGLPVFTTRQFFHTKILVRRDARINSPADLKGKRVGVPEYQQTAALWIRGITQSEFGVTPRDMEFWMEREPARSHAGAVGFKPPPGVTIHQIPPHKSIGSMMVKGELDACMFYIRNQNLIDRSSEDLYHHPDIKPLFPDSAAEGVRYFEKTGIYPINHGMVVKREIAERNPWVVVNLLQAFNAANDIANRERIEHVAYHLETGRVPERYRAALAAPLITHGIKANRVTLETAAGYSLEQGLTPRLLKLADLFAASSLDS